MGGYRGPIRLDNWATMATITASGWDVAPSDLEKAIDGDPNTSTGTGQTTMSGAGVVGGIDITPPEPGVYLLGIKHGAWCGAGGHTLRVLCLSGQVGSGTWYIANTCADLTLGTAERIRNSQAHLITIDDKIEYIEFRFVCNAADTYYVKIYEIFLYKIG